MVVLKQKVITVTTSGTRVQIFASGAVPKCVVGVVLQPNTVTSAIYVGDVGVSSTAYAAKMVAATERLELPLNGEAFDLQSIYIDAATNGDKLAVLYLEKVSR